MKSAVFACVLVSLCLVVGSVAAIPARCQSPKQWFGQVFAFEAQRSGRGQVQGDYFYDESNMRKARYERAQVNSTSGRFHIIELYQEKKYYEINLDTGDCQSGPLTRPFIPHGVVDNATFTGDFLIGSSGIADASVEMTTWMREIDHEGKKFNWWGDFTLHGCIPIKSGMQGDGFFMVESFADIVLGIPDPNAFIPPAGC